MKKRIATLLAALAAAVALDLSTKALAEQSLVRYVPQEVVGEWIRLTLGYNEGVAFGLFATDGPGVIIVSGLATLLLAGWLVYALRTESHPLPAPWALGLLLGGATANFIDRLADGRVTDFLDIGIGTYRWPTFNLADAFIMIGVGLLMWASYAQDPAEEPPAEESPAEPGQPAEAPPSRTREAEKAYPS